MRMRYIVVIAVTIALAVLVSGCSGPGEKVDNNTVANSTSNVSPSTGPGPANAVANSTWYEYAVSEEFLFEGRPSFTENRSVRVETIEDTGDTGMLHKRISITPMYENLPMYDVWVDGSTGKILRGNFTSLNMGVPHVSLVPAGGDYAAALGYLDVLAALGTGKGATPETIGFETITFDGQPYNCTFRSIPTEEYTYTVWHNSSLPWPAKIVASPAAPDQTVRRTYQLAGWKDSWKDNTSAGTGIPKTVAKPGPSRLFKIEGLAWYSYQYEVGTYRQLLKAEHSDTTYEGVPARQTKIDNVMPSSDTIEEGLIYERQADGKVLYGNFTDYVRGEPGFVSLIPGIAAQDNYYPDVAGYRDIAAVFNADRDQNVTQEGSETVEYDGRQYDCTIYLMPAGNANYTVWSNASVPVPLKVTVGCGSDPDQVVYWLTGYGKEKIQGVPTARPVPTPTPATKSGSSALFHKDNLTWYRYVVAVPMNDTVRHEKLKVEYGVHTYGTMAPNGTMLDIRENMTNVEHNWYADGYLGSVSIYENESGAVVGGATSGRDLNKGYYGALGLDAEQARAHKGEDPSTWFNASTDDTMRYVSRENIRYNGDLYACGIYEMTSVNVTYRVWRNTSLPMPPKIVVDTHRYPAPFYGFPGGYQVIGPSTYELLDWG